MFYYISKGKNSHLEVSINKDFSESDIDRVLLFIETFIEDSNEEVVFKVIPDLVEQFQEVIKIQGFQPFLKYNIIVNVA